MIIMSLCHHVIRPGEISARQPLWDGLRWICQVGRSVGTRHDAGHGWEVETHHVHKAVPQNISKRLMTQLSIKLQNTQNEKEHVLRI